MQSATTSEEFASPEERIRYLEEFNSKLLAQIEQLQATIARLEERLNRDSRNSNQPPSTDGPKVKRKPKKKSGRKRGAQPGHKGVSRTLAGSDRVNKRIEVMIEGPCECGDSELISPSFTRRHQKWEIPEIRPIVTEYALQSGRCQSCRKRRSAGLPKEAAKGILGPRAKSFVGMLTGQYRLSRRNASQFLSELMGLDVSLGTVSNTERSIAAAIKQPCKQILEVARNAKALHVDETGHKRFGKRRWTWVLSTPELVAFKAGYQRNRKSLMAILGSDFDGTIISDKYNVYNIFSDDRHQLCWAHFHRKFRALSEREGEIGETGKQLLSHSKKVFRVYRDHRQGSLSYEDYFQQLLVLREHMKQLLGKHHLLEEVRPLAHAYWLEPNKVWHFAAHPEVEPTNNPAERDLRPCVIWRKTSFGTWSMRGDRYLERMLTFVGTLRKQGKRVLCNLVDAVERAQMQLPAPSVL